MLLLSEVEQCLKTLGATNPLYKRAYEVLLGLRHYKFEAFYGWARGDGFWIAKPGEPLVISLDAEGDHFWYTTPEAQLLLLDLFQDERVTHE